MGNNYLLTKVQSQLFDGIIIVTWVLYIIIVLGLSANAPDYLDDLQYYVKIYISLFLIWRFNPFRHVKFTYLDAKIAFNAGIFLIMTTFIGSFIQKYTSEIQSIMKKI
jgi:hypothetical protein